MRPVSEIPKKYCPGSDTAVEKLELRQRWLGEVHLAKDLGNLFVQCPKCTRILVPTPSGRLRKHQSRNPNTASLDRTRDTLWASARPIEGDPVTKETNGKNAMAAPEGATPCPFCGKTFASQRSLDRHQNAVHPEEVAARIAAEIREIDATFFAELDKRFEEKLQAAVTERRWADVAALGNWYQTTYLIFPEALEALNG